MIIWSAKLPWKPPSSNHSYLRSANKRMYMPKEVSDYKKNVAEFARLTYSGKMRLDNLRVEVEHYFSDKRRRDCTNYSKALLDSLENIVYKDDKQLVDVRMKLLHANTDYSIIKIYDDL